MPRVTRLQHFVGKHLAKRRRNVHREARFYASLMKTLKNEDEREIDFSDRLVQPIFLEKFRVFRMPHERQVSMQDEAKITGHFDCGLRIAERGFRDRDFTLLSKTT